VVGLAAFFANRMMRLFRKNVGIGFPEITVRLAVLVLWWNCLPERPASGFAAISDHESHDLSGATTHRRPQPAFVRFSEHKQPDFIQFEYIFRFGKQQGGL
jgi:hypothetical protein